MIILTIGYLSAVFLRGFYVACAIIGTPLANIIFVASVIIMYICVYQLIKRTSYRGRSFY